MKLLRTKKSTYISNKSFGWERLEVGKKSQEFLFNISSSDTKTFLPFFENNHATTKVGLFADPKKLGSKLLDIETQNSGHFSTNAEKSAKTRKREVHSAETRIPDTESNLIDPTAAIISNGHANNDRDRMRNPITKRRRVFGPTFQNHILTDPEKVEPPLFFAKKSNGSGSKTPEGCDEKTRDTTKGSKCPKNSKAKKSKATTKGSDKKQKTKGTEKTKVPETWLLRLPLVVTSRGTCYVSATIPSDTSCEQIVEITRLFYQRRLDGSIVGGLVQWVEQAFFCNSATTNINFEQEESDLFAKGLFSIFFSIFFSA